MTKRELLEALAEVEDDALILVRDPASIELFAVCEVGEEQRYERHNIYVWHRDTGWFEPWAGPGSVLAVVLS